MQDVAHMRELLLSLPQPPRWIFHLAGTTHAADMRAVNVVWAQSLLEAAAYLNPQPVVVLVGSAAEYGPQMDNPHSHYGYSIPEDTVCKPATDYGRSKLEQTALGLRAAPRQPVVMVRPFNVIGEGMPTGLALGNFVRQALKLPPPSSGGPRCISTGPLYAVRDFVHVRMCTDAIIHLACCPQAQGQIVNIATGVGMSLRAMVELLCQQLPPPVYIDAPEPPPNAADVAVGNTEKLRSLAFEPQPCNVLETIQHMLQSHPQSR